MSNNAIQNAQQLSRVDKHNYRKYDNDQEDIVIVRGTSSLYNGVKELYLKEFEEARIKYNETQRETRKINNYFSRIIKQEDKDKIINFIDKVDKTNSEYQNIQELSITLINVEGTQI